MAMNPVCFTKYRCKYGKMTIVINYRPHGKSFQEHDGTEWKYAQKNTCSKSLITILVLCLFIILHLFRFNNADPVQ